MNRLTLEKNFCAQTPRGLCSAFEQGLVCTAGSAKENFPIFKFTLKYIFGKSRNFFGFISEIHNKKLIGTNIVPASANLVCRKVETLVLGRALGVQKLFGQQVLLNDGL